MTYREYMKSTWKSLLYRLRQTAGYLQQEKET
jgi:hypothetical protein